MPDGDAKVNILLVDDQPARLLSYRSVLEELDQNLVCAHSGAEALACLMEMEFALILLDVSMPGMDGFETAAMIHDHPRFEFRRAAGYSVLRDARPPGARHDGALYPGRFPALDLCRLDRLAFAPVARARPAA